MLLSGRGMECWRELHPSLSRKSSASSGEKTRSWGKLGVSSKHTSAYRQPQSEEGTKVFDDTPRTGHIRYSNVWLYLYTVYTAWRTGQLAIYWWKASNVTRNVVSQIVFYSIAFKAAFNDAGFSGYFRTNVSQNPCHLCPPHQQVLKIVRHEDWHFSGLQEELLSHLITVQPESCLDIVQTCVNDPGFK